MTTIVPVDAANSSSGTTGTVSIGKEITVFQRSQPANGGALMITTVREANQNVVGVASSYVPSLASGNVVYLNLSDAKSDLGVPMTAAAGTPAGTVGISRTAGTSTQLVGEATSSSAKTDKALFEFDLPFTYNAGTPINFVVNAQVTGSGTLTAASTTITPTLYTETSAGAEAAAVAGASLLPTSQQMTVAPSDLTFVSGGFGLTPGQHLVLELVMLVTSSTGANVGTIDSVRMQFQQGQAASPGTRYLLLTNVKNDTGVPTTAAGTATTFGIARTAGTSLTLFGATTSGAATVTTKGLFEFNLPDTYNAGSNINLYVNALLSTLTDITAATTTITPTLYTENVLGVETAFAMPAVQIPGIAATDMAFVIPGANLTPGQHVVLELVMAVTTTTGGAAYGQVNSVRYVC